MIANIYSVIGLGRYSLIVISILFLTNACSLKQHSTKQEAASDVAKSLEVSLIVDYVTPSGYAPNCSRSDALELLSNFVNSFNDGDQQQLASLFPEETANVGNTNVLLDDPSLFQQYVVNVDGGGPQSFVAYDRRDALAYFAERHRENERLQLQSLTIIPRSKDTVILFDIERRADDITATEYAGKGGNQLRPGMDLPLGHGARLLMIVECTVIR